MWLVDKVRVDFVTQPNGYGAPDSGTKAFYRRLTDGGNRWRDDSPVSVSTCAVRSSRIDATFGRKIKRRVKFLTLNSGRSNNSQTPKRIDLQQ